MNKNKAGYTLIFAPDHKYSETKKGWISEHRAVTENFIKRKLNPGECIHHLDGDKKNNDIKNLMIFKNNKEHASFHIKIKQFGLTNNIKRLIKNRWNNGS